MLRISRYFQGMDQEGHYGSNDELAIGKVPYRDFMHFSGGELRYSWETIPLVERTEIIRFLGLRWSITNQIFPTLS